MEEGEIEGQVGDEEEEEEDLEGGLVSEIFLSLWERRHGGFVEECRLMG